MRNIDRFVLDSDRVSFKLASASSVIAALGECGRHVTGTARTGLWTTCVSGVAVVQSDHSALSGIPGNAFRWAECGIADDDCHEPGVNSLILLPRSKKSWMTRLLSSTARALVVLVALAACSDTQPAVDAFNARALEHLNADHASEAIVLLDSAIALNPKFAGSYKNRGNAYRRTGDIDGAIRDYTTAISLDGTDARFFNDRGFAYLRQHKYELSIQDFDSALVLNPSHALAQQNRGRTWYYVGDLEKAEQDLAVAIKRDSTNIYLSIWLHMLRSRLHHPDTAAFAKQIATMDTVKWPGPVARFYLGRISADELHKLSAGTDSTTTTDQNCAWFYYLGEDQLIKGDTAGAIGNLKQAEAVCPQRFSEYYGATNDLKRLKGPRA